MQTDLINLIQEIHNSNRFGIVCETGCGQPVAQSLYAISGASKTIFFSESPYSKVYQDEKFGFDENRAVSLEKVQHFLKHYVERYTNCNFYYVASFQIGDETNKITTHGWIGYYSRLEADQGVKFYHVSIYEAMSRQSVFLRLAE